MMKTLKDKVAAITGATENSVSRRAGRKAVEHAEIGGSPA